MNRLASPIRRPKTPVTIIAKLDLSNADQRRLHDLVRRFHAGRWPLFRCLGMRQIDGTLVEAVEWLRMARPSYSVVTWHPDGLGLSWQEQESAHAARNALAAL